MKLKYLLIAFTLLLIGACKKDTTSASQTGVLSFDIEGVHHTFNINKLQVQVIDTGASKGKYLNLNTGTGAFPQVQFSIADRSNNYSSACFSTGPYSSLAANSACHDSISSNFCVGFFMQVIDTGIGKFGLYAATDSVSLFTLTTCSGNAPAVINGTFSAILTDSTGFISPKHVTNGQLSNINYIH